MAVPIEGKVASGGDPVLSPGERQRVLAALKRVGATGPCPRCAKDGTQLVDGYLMHVIQKDVHSLELSGKGVPTVALICNHCGLMSEFALGALGLLPTQDGE